MQQTKSWSKTTEPTSYQQIYKYIEQALDKCSKYVDDLEKDYYQGASTSLNLTTKGYSSRRPLSVNTLLSWSGLLNELVNARSVGDLRNGKSVRDLLNEAKVGLLNTPVSDESVFLMRRILDITNDQLRSKTPVLATKIVECLNVMEQYFLSFYEIENIQDIIQKKKKETPTDEYLDTPYTYEKSRSLHIFHANKTIKLLREMQQRVEDIRGINLSSLSKESQELAVECNCTSLPYIFALPECYIEARRAILALRTWLTEDAKYTSFLHASVRALDEKYNDVKKAFEISKAHHSSAEYRADAVRIQLDKIGKENEINEKKTSELEDRFSKKEQEYLSKRLTYEVYEEQLKKMIKTAQEVRDGIDNHATIERFQLEIKQLSRELPKIKSQIDAIKARLEYFKQRKQEYLNMKNEYKKLERDVQLALEDKILKENEFNRLVHARDMIRNISKCRSADDLPQKIYYSLPVKPKHGGEYEDDDLSKAIRLTAKHIGRDWNRLYWQLPFYPTRGRQEISKDIGHIDDKYHRGDIFHDQTIDALNKWRRFHTRAKLDDLIESLRKIRRFDIIQIIDERILKPKQVSTEEHEEIDPRKKEIEDLNRKLNRLFEKIRTGAISTHETYVYSTIGLDPLKPFMKASKTSRLNSQSSSRGKTPQFRQNLASRATVKTTA